MNRSSAYHPFVILLMMFLPLSCLHAQTQNTKNNPSEYQQYTTTVIDYCGNFIYENGKLSRILFDGGYITFPDTMVNEVTIANINKPQYHFYFTDHLGNVRVVTDAQGNVEQVNSYYPYGGLMASSSSIATPSSSYPANQPYRYNGKELDRKNGLDWMDYGARHFAGHGQWTSLDPLAEKYYDWSPYAYCIGNPMNLLDTDGRKILFVNGYWNSSFIGQWIGSPVAKEGYWGVGFSREAQKFFDDYSPINSTNYIDGSSMWGGDMSGGDRYRAGYQFARNHIRDLTSGMKDGEEFNMVTHSEGSAYGAGVAQYLLDAGYKVNTILHLSADEGDEFSTPQAPYTLQLSYQGDWVTGNKVINNVDKVGEIVKGNLNWLQVHGITKNRSVFRAANDLKTVLLQDNIGTIKGRTTSWKSQQKGSTLNKTNFYSINGYKLRNENGTEKK